ncbi:hypothetical protein [Actinomadura sp. 21ATH]|uniref:hypothetical protein n=1 Tax=Actinomadura sp. 21ATH TaxID=1735444 RepID=UPI0035BF1E0C
MDYGLTPLGGSLHSTIKALVTWTEEHQSRIAAARTAYDAAASAGAAAGAGSAEGSVRAG